MSSCKQSLPGIRKGVIFCLGLKKDADLVPNYAPNTCDRFWFGVVFQIIITCKGLLKMMVIQCNPRFLFDDVSGGCTDRKPCRFNFFGASAILGLPLASPLLDVDLPSEVDFSHSK